METMIVELRRETSTKWKVFEVSESGELIGPMGGLEVLVERGANPRRTHLNKALEDTDMCVWRWEGGNRFVLQIGD